MDQNCFSMHVRLGRLFSSFDVTVISGLSGKENQYETAKSMAAIAEKI